MVSWILSTLLVTAVAGQTDCTIVYFGAPNCGPCEQLAPSLSRLKQEGWDIRAVNASQDTALSQQYRIQNLPTVVILSHRREVDRIVGAVSYEELNGRFNRAAARSQSSVGSSLAVAEPARAKSGMVVRGQSPAAAGFPLLAASPRTPSAALVAAEHAAPSSTPNLSSLPENAPSEASAQSANAISTSQLSVAQAIARAAAATVRIVVEENTTTAYGTGTIIDAHGAEALILTCGHIFRDMKPGSQLSVDLFAGTPQETNISARLIDFKAEDEDIGLLSVELPIAIEPVEILPRSQKLQIGQRVFSFGCDHGNDPTRRDTQISNIDRFLGAANVEIVGAPAVGRSGGGLFDQQGRLIGVCNAADTTDNEGIYAAAEVVYTQMERLGMSHLFDSQMDAPATQLAAVDQSRTPRSGLASFQAASFAQTASPPANPGQPSPHKDRVPAANPAALEIICIVRDDSGQSHVVTIPGPSAELLQTIEQHSRH